MCLKSLMKVNKLINVLVIIILSRSDYAAKRKIIKIVFGCGCNDSAMWLIADKQFLWDERKRKLMHQKGKKIKSETKIFFSYRDILSMMWLMRVSENPGINLWMISFTKRSVTPGQLRSASSKDERRSITSVEFLFPLLLLLLYWCRLLVI